MKDQVEQYLELLQAQAELAERVEVARNLMMDVMHKTGMLSVKTDKATVSVAKRLNKRIDERVFEDWLKDQPSLEPDMFYVSTLDKKKAELVAEKVLKEQGEVVPFITTSETEYLSVRKAK